MRPGDSGRDDLNSGMGPAIRLGLRGCGFGFGRGALAVTVEAAGLHGGYGFGITHEGFPDERGAEIFCHEKAYAEIDAENIGVVPMEIGMKGVAESVAAPGLGSVRIVQPVLHAQAIGCDEWQRAGGSVRYD